MGGKGALRLRLPVCHPSPPRLAGNRGIAASGPGERGVSGLQLALRSGGKRGPALPHELGVSLQEFIFGVCSEAWEGTALGTEWVWSSDQVSFPPFKPPSKPNSSQFFAPKLTDLGDPVLSDRFPLHPLDLKLHFVLLLFIKNDYFYRFFFSSYQFQSLLSTTLSVCVHSCAFYRLGVATTLEIPRMSLGRGSSCS